MESFFWTVVILGGAVLVAGAIVYAMVRRREARKPASVKSLEKERRQEALASEKDEVLEEALEDTFPASDPVSATATTTSGAPDRERN